MTYQTDPYARGSAQNPDLPHSRGYNPDYSHARDYGESSRYSQARDSAENAGAWIVDTARRNPEALLVLAAGVALLMRGGNRLYRSSFSGDDYGRREDEEYVAELYRENERERGGTGQSVRDSVGGTASSMRDSVSGMAKEASEYASDVADRVYETASSYASSAASYAEEQRKYLARRASRISNQAGEMLHEQPLAVAALGLVTGAAVAAFLPSTRIEQRTLRPAREKIVSTATRKAENLIDAAAQTASRVREEATERVLKQGKEVARAAGETFTSKVSGGEKSGSSSGSSQASGSGASGGGSSTSGGGAGAGGSRSSPAGTGGGSSSGSGTSGAGASRSTATGAGGGSAGSSSGGANGGGASGSRPGGGKTGPGGGGSGPGGGAAR